jgi:hypothetical protein
LESIDVDAIRTIELQRADAQKKAREAHNAHAVLSNTIRENQANIANFRLQYDNLSKRLGQGKAVSSEIDKIKRLSA